MGREEVLGAVRAAVGRSRGESMGVLAPFSFPSVEAGDLVGRFRAALEAVSGTFVDGRGRDVEELLEPYRQAGSGVVEALWGVAESGSVVIEHDGTHLPTLIPETTVLVLDVDKLRAGLEDLPVPGADARARIVITGPSRTADIEKRLVLGAHGPRRVVVVLTSGTRPAPTSA